MRQKRYNFVAWKNK